MIGRLAALPLAIALASGGAGSLRADAPADPSGAETSPEPTDSIETEGSSSVTSALQGKEGVRIQTMCTHCNSANVQVGGLNQDLVPLHQDGFPVLGGLATSFLIGVLPADTVAEAQVTKGPGLARQPSAAAGGLIELTRARPDELPWVEIGLEGGSYARDKEVARGAGPIADWLQATAVVGRESADPVDDDEDGWNDVGAVERRFAEAGILLEPGRNHRVALGASWIDEDTTDARGAFDADVYIQNLPPDPADWPGPPAWTREDTLLERTEYRGGWEWRTPSRGTLSLRLLDSDRTQRVLSQQTRDPDSQFSAFVERLRIRDDDLWGGMEFSQPLRWDFRLRAGIDARDQEVDAETRDLVFNPGAPPETVTDAVRTRAGFVELDWTPSARWTLEGGVRYDDLAWEAVDLGVERTATGWSPRATVQFSPKPGWRLRAIAGRSTRAPSPIFAQVCCGQKYERNVNARREVGETVALEGIYQPSPDLRVSAYVGRTDFDDHLLRLVGSSFFFIQTYTFGNIPSARADTAEIAARWAPLRWLSLDASAGWLRFENRGDPAVQVNVTPLFRQDPVRLSIPITEVPYQPGRTGSISAAFTLPKGVLLTVGVNYTGSMWIQQYLEDPLEPRTVTGIAPDGTQVEVLTLLRDEMRETPSFWLANVELQVDCPKGFVVVAGVDNVTDEIQSDLGDPTTDYNWGPLSGRSWRLGLRYRFDR